jgi:hypothetical protein
MLDTRSVLRCGLIVCIAGAVGIAVSVAVAAGEGGFPLALATPGSVQSGSQVQSASGVLKTLYRLALDADYTEADAEDIVAAAARLIETGSIPPGLILQVSRQFLSDLTAAELIGLLEEIAQRIADGEPPGQVVNDIVERGNGKYQVRRGHGNNSEGDARGRGNNYGDDTSQSGTGTATGSDSGGNGNGGDNENGNSGGDTSD